jgi:hypothetical protein
VRHIFTAAPWHGEKCFGYGQQRILEYKKSVKIGFQDAQFRCSIFEISFHVNKLLVMELVTVLKHARKVVKVI